MSQHTGFKLFLIIALTQDMIVNDGTTTSEFYFKFNEAIATSSAVEPFEVATENFLSKLSANFCSKELITGLFPEIEVEYKFFKIENLSLSVIVGSNTLSLKMSLIHFFNVWSLFNL